MGYALSGFHRVIPLVLHALAFVPVRIITTYACVKRVPVTPTIPRVFVEFPVGVCGVRGVRVFAAAVVVLLLHFVFFLLMPVCVQALHPNHTA